MQHSTTTKQKDILNIQENAEETHKENSSLTEREKIENTPFWMIKTDEGWFIVMGDYRLTEPVESKILCQDKLQTEQWMIIMRMTAVITEKTLYQLSEQKVKQEYGDNSIAMNEAIERNLNDKS